MRPFPTQPAETTLALLPGATFADAFSIDLDDAGLDAVSAANLVFSSTPMWINRLLAVRNAVVRPFGLKVTNDTALRSADRIGFFPCLSRSPERVVLGFNDAHLDFRIAVDAQSLAGTSKRFTATTIVKPHNLFGRMYLATIMPFHKLIVPTMLRRVQQH